MYKRQVVDGSDATVEEQIATEIHPRVERLNAEAFRQVGVEGIVIFDVDGAVGSHQVCVYLLGVSNAVGRVGKIGKRKEIAKVQLVEIEKVEIYAMIVFGTQVGVSHCLLYTSRCV